MSSIFVGKATSMQARLNLLCIHPLFTFVPHDPRLRASFHVYIISRRLEDHEVKAQHI